MSKSNDDSFVVQQNGSLLPQQHSMKRIDEVAAQRRSNMMDRICCCFGSQSPPSVHTHFRRTSIFHSELYTPQNDNNELKEIGQTTSFQSTGDARVSVQGQFDDSMFFFDAVEDQDDLDAMLELYPIVTTAAVPPKPRVSLDQPETMLGHDQDGHIFQDAMSHRNLVVEQSKRRLSVSENSNASNTDVLRVVPSGMTSPTGPTSAVNENTTIRRSSISSNKHHNHRPRLLRRLSSQFFPNSTRQMEQLQQPHIYIQERGFPGSLSPDELEACQRLNRELKQRPDLAEIVYSLRSVEEAPYALCRFLRATKFQVDNLLQRLDSLKQDFHYAKTEHFYPDLAQIMDPTPLYAFLTCYPFLTSGRAKNGCPVNYFAVGKIQAQALYSMVPRSAFEAFMWHQSVHAFSRNVQQSMDENPNFVRMESVTVLDLAGLTYASASSSEATDAIQLASHIGDCFPETLHCMIILNAPTYFAALWNFIKQMIDPRTAKRIQVFSSTTKGTARLREMIADEQIPSDYGGTGPTLAEVMEELSQRSKDESITQQQQQQENDPSNGEPSSSSKKKVKRTIVESIVLKRKALKEHRIELKGGEIMKLKIFTRSSTPAKVSVHGMDMSVRTDVSAKSLFDETLQGKEEALSISSDQGITGKDKRSNKAKELPTYLPVSTTVGTRMVGPGTFAIKLQDLGESSPSGVPSGQYVIVGEVS